MLKTMSKWSALVATLAMALVLVGCGGEKKEKAKAPTPPKPAGAAKSLDAAPAGDTAPPPPAPTAAPAASAAAAASGTVNVTVPSGPAAEGDVLRYFRTSPTGQKLDDVGALQQVIDAYGRTKADIVENAGDVALPNLKKNPDLNLLVKSGLLKALPTPPPGQKFVFDPKTMKVSLANE